jgi:glutathione S-transferase
MKLYYSPGACSLSPHIVMAEMNMAYETEAVNLKDKTCTTGNFFQINPKGCVPALKMDNGEILTEGTVICQYLADMKNDGMLLAKYGTTERYRTMEWMNFIATDIHKNFSPLFSADKIYNSPEVVNAVKTNYLNVLNEKMNFVSEKLGMNDYLMGKNFTIADAYMFTCLSWTKYVGMNMDKWSNLNSYMKRVSERPAVMKAMKEEGLLK